MHHIGKLCLIAPTPEDPKGAGSFAQWDELEREFDFRFPDTYKELCSNYGAGSFADFFGVANPFYRGPHYVPYKEWIQMRLKGIEQARSAYPEEAIDLPIYPKNGGLFPWGYTDNGGTMCWLTEGESSCWKIICLDEAYSKNYDRLDLSIVEFIEKWLTGEISVPTLTPPDFYPIKRPVFSSYS